MRRTLRALCLGWVATAAPLVAQEWEVHPEATIAAPGGDGTFWGGITGVAMVGQRVFALDAVEGRLYGFDRHGAPVWSASRRGAGPGEVSQYAGAVLALDTVLAVPDPGNRRVTYFTLSGQVKDTEPLLMPDGVAGPWGVVAGRVIYLVRPLTHAAVTEREDAPKKATVYLRDSSTGGGTVLLTRDVEEPMTITADGRLVVNLQPERLLVATDGHLLYAATTRHFQIDVLDAQGNVLHEIRKDMPPVRIPPSVLEQRRREAEALRSRLPAQLTTDYRFSVEVPETEPVLLGLVAGDGFVFVRLPSEADAPAADRRWDIFARDGGPKGHVMLPRRFTPRAFSAGLIVGVTRDAYDVETLVFLRLAPPGS